MDKEKKHKVAQAEKGALGDIASLSCISFRRWLMTNELSVLISLSMEL